MNEVLIGLIQVLGSGAAIALSISGLRWLLARYDKYLPRSVYPLMAYALGAGAEALLAYTTGHVDPVRGALISVLAGHLREWVTTLQQHGATGK